jgi:hypothetical protein
MSIYQDLLNKALEAHNQLRQNLRSPRTMGLIDTAVADFAKPFDAIAAAIDGQRNGRFSGDFTNTIVKLSDVLLAQMEVLGATLDRAEANDRATVMGIVVQRGPAIELANKLKETDAVLFSRAAEIVLMTSDDAMKAAGGATEFQALVAQWKQATLNESSIERMTKDPSYRQIVAMGETAVPLLLEEMRERPDYWFAALREITKTDPVPAEARGDLDRMTEAWLQWGRANGYLQEPA